MASYSKDKLVLEAVEKAEAELVREMKRKCDWDEPNDRAIHISQERNKQRMIVIRRLAPDGRCPTCRRVRRKSAEWVILKREDETRFISCRSCCTTAKSRAEAEELADRLGAIEAFPSAEVRVTVDGFQLARARSLCGLTYKAFAEKAGWSVSYQRKLEGPARTVSLETAQTCLQVLRETGGETADNIVALIKEAKDDAGKP